MQGRQWAHFTECTAGDDPKDVTAGAEDSGVLAVFHASLDALHRTEEPEEVRRLGLKTFCFYGPLCSGLCSTTAFAAGRSCLQGRCYGHEAWKVKHWR